MMNQPNHLKLSDPTEVAAPATQGFPGGASVQGPLAVRKPLTGIRVLELARVLAGPWAGQLLADLGCDVIKVERPDGGDDTRHWGPPFVTAADGTGLGAAYYHSTNRGKRSIALDLTKQDGQQRVRDLALECDVIIENYKVGGLAKYGLDARTLCTLNPRLIYCSITGFGQTGPYAQKAGYDFVIQGMGGLMSITGEPDGPPEKGGIAHADLYTALYSVVAILGAIEERHHTGTGAKIDMALLDTQVGILGNQALNWMVSGVVPNRMGNGHVNLAPYQSFPTADGDLIIAVGNDPQFAKLCSILDLSAMAEDPRFKTSAARVNNRQILIPLLTERTVTMSTQELLEACDSSGVPAGPVNRIDQVFADPQVRSRGMQTRLKAGADEFLPGLAVPIVIDGRRVGANACAPRLDGDRGATWHPFPQV